jgi:tetratricopeptide (TPR) repeat protein
MQRAAKTLVAILPFTWLAHAAVVHAQKVGDVVIAIHDVELTENDKNTGKFFLGQYSRVQAVKDDLLWVEPGARGWVNRKDVLPLAVALDYFTKQIAENPNDDQVYYARGAVYFNQHQYDKAIADQTEAIRLNPKRGAYHNDRGLNWESKGDYDRAIADYDDAIRLKSNNFMYYNNRGRTYRLKGDYDRSVADYDQSLKLSPKYSPAYQGRGVARRLKGDFDNALADFNEAIRLNPVNGLAYESLALLQATCPDDQYRDGKKAIENAQKAVKQLGPKDDGALDALAAACAETGDFAKAQEYETKALTLVHSDKTKARYAERYESYKQNKPYRQEVKPK